MIAQDSVRCAVMDALEHLNKFFETKMCTKCLPCMMGIAEAIGILDRISRGEGKTEDISFLEVISTEVAVVARCKFGREAAEFLKTSLSSARSVYGEHIEEKQCSSKSCFDLIGYQISSEKCTSCDLCKEVCPEEAILGEKYIAHISDNRPYVILKKKCTKCGKCLPVCEVGAIEAG